MAFFSRAATGRNTLRSDQVYVLIKLWFGSTRNLNLCVAFFKITLSNHKIGCYPREFYLLTCDGAAHEYL